MLRKAFSICARSAVRSSAVVSFGGLTVFAGHKAFSGELFSQGVKPNGNVNIPGTNPTAVSMFPVRTLVFTVAFSITYPALLLCSVLRAVYLRAVIGMPSKILATGTFNDKHVAGIHYTCQMLFSEPFDEQRLRKALVGLCKEDGILEHEVELLFCDEVPQDWPSSGSWPMTHFVPKSIPEGGNVGDYYQARPQSGKLIRLHVFNGSSGKPTVILYAGSLMAWDGSANYNFNRELQERYMGKPPNKVFQKPIISKAAAAKADSESFGLFMMRLPVNLAKSLGGLLWNAVRAAEWAGGNGIGFKFCAMNFTEEESKALYNGAKTLGISPFACFTYAAHKACGDVLGQSFERVVQQASLQTRHFPISGEGADRNFIGDWLVGPVSQIDGVYTLEKAQESYKQMNVDLDTFGPMTSRSFLAKAYGLVNSGAAMWEIVPTYNDDAHVFDRCLFMNNYGVRNNANPSFEAWNWNAPLWLGVNTINVNGKTTTLVGSFVWGLPVVELLRDNIEAILRQEIMSQAPKSGCKSIPTSASKPAGAIDG